MGCWTETCAVSHAPVLDGNKVTMIVLTPKGAAEAWWMEISHAADCIESLHKNVTYNDYGWINEVKYKKKEEKERPDFRSIFIHQDIWDAIQKVIPTIDDLHYCQWLDNHYKVEEEMRQRSIARLPAEVREKLDEELWGAKKRLDSEILKLARFAYNCRLNLNAGIAYKGSQHYDDEQFEIYARIVQQQAEKLTTFIRERD